MKFDINDRNFSIWYSENIKNIEREYYINATQKRCYICKKVCSSFCNSHSIPQFVLQHLSEQGSYSNFANIAKIDFLKPKVGKSKAGTFDLICRKCDSSFFSDYENKDIYVNLEKTIPAIVLSEIAIKNHLFAISKANNELSLGFALLKYIKENKPEFYDYFRIKQEFQLKLTEKRMKIIENIYAYDKYYFDKDIPTYEIIEQIELPYTLPIAYQQEIPIMKGLSGEKINTFVEGLLYLIHMCVFPLENKSLILLFSHCSDDKYNQFKKDFKSLSLDKKLEIANLMILQYSEDFYCNTEILEKVNKDNNLTEYCTSHVFCNLEPSEIVNIPNLLLANI